MAVQTIANQAWLQFAEMRGIKQNQIELYSDILCNAAASNATVCSLIVDEAVPCGLNIWLHSISVY